MSINVILYHTKEFHELAVGLEPMALRMSLMLCLLSSYRWLGYIRVFYMLKKLSGSFWHSYSYNFKHNSVNIHNKACTCCYSFMQQSLS